MRFSLLWRIFGYTRKYPAMRRWLFIVVILRGIQLPLLTWAIGRIISGPIEQENPGLLAWSVFGFVALSLFIQATFYLRHRIGHEMNECIVRDIRNEVFGHLMRQTMHFYDTTRIGRIISRLTSDVEALRRGLQVVFFASIINIGQMIGAAILLAITNWVLFLTVLVLGPLLWAMDRYFRKRMSRASRAVQESYSLVTATIAESVKGIRVTQGFVREKTNSRIFDRLANRHSDSSITLAKETALFLPILELNTQFSMALILIVGGYGVMHPDIGWQVGDLITFLFLATLFFAPLKNVGRHFTIALAAMAGAERIFRLLDTQPDWEDPMDAVPIPRMEGRVRFEDVTFSYDGRTEVLHGISFRADPGETIALVGHTGSGKSTIINLISKFYLPTGGRITFDGRDVTTIQSASLREQLGIVLQKNFLFTGSVIDNIRLGRPEASDEAVIQTVERLGCRDLIEAMPHGFQTHVSENGVGLSQGQQQVVCFARALIADPRILILDEATSSVDILTEMRLQKALENLLRGRTCFIVAHRLSTIRNADCVLVLDHGRIVERGAHIDLLRNGGPYTRLYRQFAA